MTEFERLLQDNYVFVERYVKYKVGNLHDAEDIVQEVCLAATLKFDSLKKQDSFKPWLIGIAKHKCNDYYRKKARDMQISIEMLSESALCVGRFGVMEQSVVGETLDMLGDKEKHILYLYFFKDMSQEDISRRLSVPIGTVKSRLHYAKEKFKQHYPNQRILKGANTMKRLPEMIPEYRIESLNMSPFAVVHEELPGMFVIPRLGEKITFGMYDFPSRKQNGVYKLNVTGKICIHDVEGVAIHKEYSENGMMEEGTIFAQLSDSHCKYLGGITCDKNGNQNLITFLDSNFDDYFGIGEDNCGFSTNRIVEGRIQQTEKGLVISEDDDISDIVGSFKISFGEKTYETVRLIDYQKGSSGGMLCEHYLDKNGRSVLWRRFNHNNWAYERYGKQWTEMLPENETMVVNGELYVHWYDCITDYIL